MEKNNGNFGCDDCLVFDDDEKYLYMDFKDSIRKDNIVPILVDGNVLLYRFCLSDVTKEIFDRLIEERNIPEHTDLVYCVPYYDGTPRRIVLAPGKRDLSFESFKDYLTRASLDGYIKDGESIKTAFNNWKAYFRVHYFPAHKEKFSSKLSQIFYCFCEYHDLDFLLDKLYEYLFDVQKCFDDKGPKVIIREQSNVDIDVFNETESAVFDKKSLIMEILKSLNVELLFSINLDDENDFVLSKIFNFSISDSKESERLRKFIGDYAKHNSEILFNSELFDVFSELPLQTGIVKDFTKKKGTCKNNCVS